MNVEEVKDYLETKLPEFTLTTGKEAGQPEQNWNSIQVLRDGLHIVYDVSKVEDKKAAKQLLKLIQAQWSKVE